MPKSEWSQTLQVVCGWNKAWDPPVVQGCIDPRGCQPPPARNMEVWGNFDDSNKNLDVGVTYWYSCKAGKQPQSFNRVN